MIEHLVIFKFKPEASGEPLERAAAALKALKGKVPGILDLTVGRNFSERAKGFELGLVVRFENKAALDAYGPHPEHQAVVEQLIKPHLAELICVDYNF